MFTTLAHEAQYVFLLCRSNLDVPEAQGHDHVPRAHGHARASRSRRWPPWAASAPTSPSTARCGSRTRAGSARSTPAGRVMHAALVYERNGANWGEPHHLVESVAGWATQPGPDGTRPFDDPTVREVLARWSTELEVGRLLLFRSAWLSAQGAMPQVEGSMAKLHITEAFVRAASELVDLLGADGLVPMGEDGHRAAGPRRARLPSRGRHDDLRREQRGAAGDHRRPGPRPAPQPLDRAKKPRNLGDTGAKPEFCDTTADTSVPQITPVNVAIGCHRHDTLSQLATPPWRGPRPQGARSSPHSPPAFPHTARARSPQEESEGMSNPPSTTSSPRRARRALLSTAAALTALAVPGIGRRQRRTRSPRPG